MKNKPKILFLCTGNSCRSQMAEGFAKHFHKQIYEIYSAGILAHGLNPHAIQVMQEIGVDITSQRSKTIHEFVKTPIDYVITVCGHAHETCPVFPAKCKVIHKGFDDPPKMAQQLQDETEKLNCYRKVRDEIKVFIQDLPKFLNEKRNP